MGKASPKKGPAVKSGGAKKVAAKPSLRVAAAKRPAGKAANVAAPTKFKSAAARPAVKPVAATKAKPAAPVVRAVAKSQVRAKPAAAKMAVAAKALATGQPPANGRVSASGKALVAGRPSANGKTLGASPKPADKPSSPPRPVVTIKPIVKLAPPPAEPKYQPPPQEAVPTNGKPRKNLAGLTEKDLQHFRDLLLEKRRELVGDMHSMETEALGGGGAGLSNLPVHMADMGTDNYEQEFTLGLVEKDRNLLREINSALAKTQNGTYGLCEGTGQPINKVRLEAQPWAKFSIEYARQIEQRRLRR